MSKLKLLAIVLLTITFLLSLWMLPVGLIVAALALIKTMWIKVVLCCVGVLWLLIIRPWTMFRNPRFGRFLSDMRRAINALLS